MTASFPVRESGTIGFEYDSGGMVWLQGTTYLYDSPQSAAAVLRLQAQELLLAASKLELENQ